MNPAVPLPAAMVQDSVHTHPARPRTQLQGSDLQHVAAAQQLQEHAGELQVSEGWQGAHPDTYTQDNMQMKNGKPRKAEAVFSVC